ncbi:MULTISPECIES: MFS transporter [unclassified Achromobacter]|uniref:MFS transporter n=1 Tax=unclassified Achromobacter TaxID=2626865 RepID=UPI000B516033|nr:MULTISPECIES: MFS transporter [unclassified Achromobacter]OWT71516.1 MFS transporter [Achromobacter sp. HZ34]OWT73173.1 MFS transporter [Achromobacter sp. HZ28]
MSAHLASRRTHGRTAVLLVGALGCAMTVLDTNVVGIVLPTIARDLNASFADIEWVISTYVLCFSALLLPAGSIADRYGRKRVFLCGIVLFALASCACGLAPTATALYLARGAQGVGAAFLLAPALAIIGHAFHEESARARAWAIWGAIMGLTMVLAPLIGGAINALLGWRWAFHINVPICAALALAVAGVIDESRDPTPRPLDFAGIVLFAGGMFAFTWALIVGPVQGWGSAGFLLRLGAGLVLFLGFSQVERRGRHPMLDLSLFAAPAFVGAVIAMLAYAASAQVMASLLPLFLQNARGKTALLAGVSMLPFALAMLVLPQVGRRLATRLRSYQILALGLAIVALGNLAMMVAAGHHSPALLILAMAVLGSGGGLLNGETQKAIMGTVPRHRAGMASGISTTARFSGILLGFASLGAVLAGGVQAALRDSMLHVGISGTPGFADTIAAGDLARALAMYPATLHETLTALARDSYGAGFARAFLVAGVVSLVASVTVYVLMRDRRRV